MNKKLLTAAIGAALIAGPMWAQADVKLYGRVHVSVDYLDARANTQPHSNKATTVSSNASRWGLDISEKLGGGLTAIAKLEQQVNADGDSNSQDARNRYVGLSGKWGTILAGTHDTPFKDVSRAVELFPEQIGDLRNIVNAGGNFGGAFASRGWDLRPPNSILYRSPSLNGFVAEYQYSADIIAATGTEDNRRRADSLGLKYAKGPLYVAYARESHRLPLTHGGDPTETGDRLGASYNFGAFKVMALWQSLKNMGGTEPGNMSSVNRKSWTLGGAFTAGNNVFKAQYAKADDVSNSLSGASGADTGAKMWAIGWDHLFSKTVKAYVAYAKTDNASLQNLGVNGTGPGSTVVDVRSDSVAPGAGGDPSAWSVGMIVDF